MKSITILILFQRTKIGGGNRETDPEPGNNVCKRVENKEAAHKVGCFFARLDKSADPFYNLTS